MFSWFVLLLLYLPFQIALNPGIFFKDLNIDLASIRVFILIFFSIWLIKISLDKKLKKIILSFLNFQTIFLLLFFTGAVFSLIKAENFFWGFRKILFFASIFPLYFLTYILIDNFEKIKKIFFVLIFSAFLIALTGLLQFGIQFLFSFEKIYDFWALNILPVFSGFNRGTLILAYPSWLVSIGGETFFRAFSIFSDPHIFSFYLGLILPLAIGQAIYLKQIKNKFFAFIIIIFIFFSILLSFARGAYLAIIISLLIISILVWRYLKLKKMAVILVFLILILIIPGNLFSERFYSSFNLGEESNTGRLQLWGMASQLGMNNFWLGVGLGNYSSAIGSSFGYYNPITAHNVYLDIFSEMGFFTLFVWLCLILGTIWQVFLRLKKSNSLKEKAILIALIGTLSYFSVHSFFEVVIYSPIILAILIVILGISANIVSFPRRRESNQITC